VPIVFTPVLFFPLPFLSYISRELLSSELLSNAEVPEDFLYGPQVNTNMHDSDSDNDEVVETFAKILEHTERGITPYTDIVEKINLGTIESPKELQIAENPEKAKMI